MTPSITPDVFKAQLKAVTTQLAGRPVDTLLGHWLNTHMGPDSATYRDLMACCQAGVEQGWLCQRQSPGDRGGIRYGRIFKPDDGLDGFSVDVVDMCNIAGPHHVHPTGEIDLIMPLDPTAQFDGHGAGWWVYPPGSAHPPTVSQGRALVLYLLPQGRIEFTKN